ncbi:efflux RND transporter periplasmic adaptor subunit [Chloroflexota bacterium]
MMKLFKTTLVTLVICLVSIPLLSCGSESDEAASENQVATVQLGDLTVDITAVGNLALSQTEDLAFEMAGTVEEVLVNEGDSVDEGQELVKLDTSEWDDQLKTLERKLVTAQRALTTAERLIGTKELAVRQAELDLQTAEYNLGQIGDVKAAQDEVDRAESDLEIAKSMLNSGLNSDDWIEAIDNAKEALALAKVKLQAILSGTSVTLTTSATIQVAKYQLLVEKSQRDLEDAQIAVENARIDKEDAEQDVEDAQDDLNEAKALSPIITAPFDGFITKVNAEGGDEVLKGTVAVQIADPDKFEAEILVSEMDITQVKLGGEASVQVDALSGMSLPAKVTHISPTATIQSGVVNYKVKVEVQSLEAVAQERQGERQEAMEEIAVGEMPERLKQAVEEGRITQEQADEMMERMQSGEMPFAPTGEGGQGQASTTQGSGQLPMMVPEDYQLREGLTVTVSIIVEESTNVLLVPNTAITTQGQQTYVKVASADGTIEERVIQTGITDYQFTEVTSGLSEGEQIVVPEGTTTTTTQQNRPGGIMIPGMGRPR